jgi:hypothetical protein
MDMRGMGSIYRRNGSRFWWMQWWPDGARRRQSTGKEKYKLACDVLREMISREQVSSGADLTITRLYDELAHDYKINGRKSARSLKSRWNNLKEFFGAMTASEVTPRQVTRYIGLRVAAGAAAGTINRELAALKRM